MTENPKSDLVEGEHPVFGTCSPGCRVFDAGSNAVFYELGDVMEGNELRVAAKNESLVLLEPFRISTGIPEVDAVLKGGFPKGKLLGDFNGSKSLVPEPFECQQRWACLGCHKCNPIEYPDPDNATRRKCAGARNAEAVEYIDTLLERTAHDHLFLTIRAILEGEPRP
jgi:hypothetical protein